MSSPIFCWHVHHDRLLEPLTEPIENRIAYIKLQKPPEEISLRLHLLRPVKGQLPDRFLHTWMGCGKASAEHDKAWVEYYMAWPEHGKTSAEYDKTSAEYDKALAEYYKARAEHGQALAECAPEIEALHKLECPDCPWNGSSIFQ